jgi:hypothetical protein
MIGARVVANDKNELRLFEIFELDRPLTESQNVCQRRATGFMAHIGTVGQIVRAELLGKQLISEGHLIRRLSRGVEHRLVWRGQCVQLASNQGERLVPSDWLIMNGTDLREWIVVNRAIRKGFLQRFDLLLGDP